MTETASSGTYEEKPKINFFLWAGVGFFGVMLLAVIDMPNVTTKWLWLGIASINLTANLLQINNTRNTRYVLWRRGLSIYVGKNREALVRFDKALLFKQYKSSGAIRADLREFEVAKPPRLFPAFAGGKRWLVIYEREDGERQALVFDPTAQMERAFRDRLREADENMADDQQDWDSDESRGEGTDQQAQEAVSDAGVSQTGAVAPVERRTVSPDDSAGPGESSEREQWEDDDKAGSEEDEPVTGPGAPRRSPRRSS